LTKTVATSEKPVELSVLRFDKGGSVKLNRVSILVLLAAMLAPACNRPGDVNPAGKPAGVPPPAAALPPTTTDTPPVSLRVLEDPAGAVVARGDMVAAAVPPEIAEFVPNFVIRLKARWTPGQTLQVCFIGGDPALRSRIRKAAAEWTLHGNIKLDFGASGDLRTCASGDGSNVRIGFGFAGYWSVVGNTAVKPDVQTMNYGEYDTRPPPEPRFTGVVLHEFGHALGFEHEHQHPTGGCDAEFNWPVVYSELAKPPNNWPPSKVDFNLRSFTELSAYGLSSPDRTSIMHYSLDPWMFQAGTSSKCYVPEQFALSALDKQGVSSAYPRQADTVLAEQQQVIEQLTKSLPTRAASARKYLEGMTRDLNAKRVQISKQ
jgi:hypothetical protein